MQLFYNRHINESDKQFTFDKIESKHIIRVLRKKEGDLLNITNGVGNLFTAKVRIASDKSCLVDILTTEKKIKPWPYNLHIAIAPTKSNDRFEWFLEKATEIGIDEITPILCDHSERKVLKMERMQKILEAAAKQSLKYHFPVLNEPTTFKTFISKENSTQLYIAHCEEQEKKSLKSELKESKNITILIGPEGDFSTEEIKIALEKKYTPISLGESRLRTETAGIIAAHTVSLHTL